MAIQPFETAEAHSSPTVTQLSVFLDDRVGQLLHLTQMFDGSNVHILGLSVTNLVDCAIVRMIFDDPDEAGVILTDHRFQVKETELIVVCVPEGPRGLINLWSAMLKAEINVHYTYALMGLSHGRPAVAVHADNLTLACDAFKRQRLVVLDQSDLRTEIH